MTLYSLKKRRDFKRLQKEGVKWVAPSFILQMASSSEIHEKRIGYIVTRKIGSAVIRNRVRRRLKEAVRHVFPAQITEGQDYILIARENALRQNFSELEKDLLWSLRHVQRLDREKQDRNKPTTDKMHV